VEVAIEREEKAALGRLEKQTKTIDKPKRL
jgi:hypothetical protein